jgi:hypothetical protein
MVGDMLITPAQARAYVNHGRWIADCPRDCGFASELQPKQSGYVCSECKWIGEVEWPDDADGIWEALQERAVPRTRNWFPSSHPLALKSNSPHGQSVKELMQETEENEVR